MAVIKSTVTSDIGVCSTEKRIIVKSDNIIISLENYPNERYFLKYKSTEEDIVTYMDLSGLAKKRNDELHFKMAENTKKREEQEIATFIGANYKLLNQ